MQPRQARRGTTAVAGSTLAVGVLLVVLAFVLSACGGGSTGGADITTAGTAPSTGPATSGTSASAVPSTTAPAVTPPAATTPAPAAPAPTAGGAGSTQPPVALDQPATFAAGLTATVISIEPIDATAALPGEVAGPAVRLTMAVQNAGTTAVDLGNVTVDLQDAQASSATPLGANGAQPFTGSLTPGASATGVYVFSLSTDDRAGVTLYVTASASLPVVVFTGNLS